MAVMKRFFICLLALVTVLPCLAGCGKGKTPEEPVTTVASETTETTAPELDPDDPQLEPIEGNREFSILGRTYADAGNPYLFQYSEIKDTGEQEPVNDAVVKRNLMVEEKYSIEIFMNNVSEKNIISTLQMDVLGGTHAYDIAMPILNTAIFAACNGFLTEFGTIPHIDLQKRYWMSDLYDLISIGGYNFYCPGAINLSAYNTVQTVFFNKAIHQSLQLDNVYNLVKENEWTVEKMMELAKEAGIGDTGLVTDQFGLISATMAWQPLYYSTGMTICTKDENDLPSFSALKNDTDRFYDVIEKITVMMNTHNAAAITGAIGLSGGNAFKSGQSLFWIECVYGQFKLRDMESDYGMVPIPVWNAGDPYIANIHTGFTSVCAVPSQFSEERLNFVGSVLEDMAYYSMKFVIPEYYEKLILLKGSRDEETFEMLGIIYQTIIVDLALVLTNITLDSDLREILELNKTSEIASTLKGNLPAYESVLKEVIKAFCKEGARYYE